VAQAVSESIDDDALRSTVKGMLSERISAILREELPGLLEKAIKEEIQRLVKGDK
jgi:cell pole-organizing protein PopZ